MKEIYRVIRIDEQDFGCEGRPDDAQPMVDVTLRAKDGTEQIFQEKDILLYQREIEEGDAVLVEERHLQKAWVIPEFSE